MASKTVENGGRVATAHDIVIKFSVVNLPNDLHMYSQTKVVEATIVNGVIGHVQRGHHMKVHLRSEGTEYFLAFDEGDGNLKKRSEIKLDKDQFDVLRELAKNTSFEVEEHEMTRYSIPYSGKVILLDVQSNGMKTAQVAFSSDEDVAGFRGPEWLGMQQIVKIQHASDGRVPAAMLAGAVLDESTIAVRRDA